MSTPSPETVVSNSIHQQKKQGLLGEVTDYWTRAGNIQDMSGMYYGARK